MDIEMTDRETEVISYPRDLLQRFAGTRCSEETHPSYGNARNTSSQDPGDTELSLGLSLGGCFAVEPRETRLVRSTSTEALSVLGKEKEFPAIPAALVRTCSLPMEAEEEHRKRKEMQSLKRLEAKRKRTEKRNGSRSPAAAALVGTGDKKDDGGFVQMNGCVPPRLSVCSGGDRTEVEHGRRPKLWRSSSDFAGRLLEGSEGSDLSNSSTISSNPDTCRKPPAAASPLPPLLRSVKSLQDDEALKKTPGNMGRNMMDEMPCVSTKGDGPNGRRIEGFLYKYKKGEEVRIVCVCHGSFLTPAEFVKHAGGGDVAHPLRHIVVTPSPSVYY